MSIVRSPLLTVAVTALALLGPSCAPHDVPSHAPATPAVAAKTAPAPTASLPPAQPAPSAPILDASPAPQPIAALAEARLVAASCEGRGQLAAELAEARVAKMRAEVDAELERWAEAQPDCWAMYHQQAEAWKRWRSGLGLSGIGEGGGGYGEGIGLGAIGTIGHGAGYGSGSGVVRMGAVGRARSASGTNVQVQGVDEADIVKTDGSFLYVAANGALRIVEALRPRIVSVTKLGPVLRDLYVDGDRVVAFTSSGKGTNRCTYAYDCAVAGDGTSTAIVVLDVADRAHPSIARRIELSGSLIASRRIGHAVHTVVADQDRPRPTYSTWPDGLPICGTREASVRAKFAALKAENRRKILAETSVPTLRDQGVTHRLCTSLRTAFGAGSALTTVVSFDLRHDSTPPATVTIQSRPGTVFASASALYFAVTQRKSRSRGPWYSFYSSVDEASEVHKFRIGTSPSETRYVGAGVVPGHVLNQFAMDEWGGHLRVATTRGRVPSPDVESVVSVLGQASDGNLVTVGAIEGIAPGEDIRAVRFDEERGYVVTFKKTDPLFVMDLRDPARPSMLGELKIPGFSTYIHRIDPTHLLSIGYDADDHGDFAYFDGVLLQLFDVSEPTNPRLIHKETIGTRGSSSEAATNHLAFNYFADRGLLAIPMTICEGGGDGRQGDLLSFSGLLVYRVSNEHGFERLGGVDHGTRGASCSAWWSRASSVVKRSVFLDDLVYSIADDRAKVQRLGQLGQDLADLSLL